MQQQDMQMVRGRLLQYWGVFLVLVLIGYVFRQSSWIGSQELHTLMEVVATVFASMIGVVSLVRYYSKKNSTFLLIGAGFLGTAFLDGYHAVVTSSFFSVFFPSPPSSLIPWSWVASRVFVSGMLLWSYLAWRREERLGLQGHISEQKVYWGVAIMTIISFVFFAFSPLPPAYYPDFVLGRPEELLPAIFFILALIGYLKKGWWRHDAFEHWLVLSLLVGSVSQTVFMPFSFQLFDFQFDAAHGLKKMGYIFVLIGLFISMYHLFRQADEGKEALRLSKKKIEDALLKAEKDKKKMLQAVEDMESAKRELEMTVEDLEKSNSVMVGRELRMQELKDEIEELKKQSGA